MREDSEAQSEEGELPLPVEDEGSRRVSGFGCTAFHCTAMASGERCGFQMVPLPMSFNMA